MSTKSTVTNGNVSNAISFVIGRAEQGQIEDSRDIAWYLEELDLADWEYDEAFDTLVTMLCH